MAMMMCMAAARVHSNRELLQKLQIEQFGAHWPVRLRLEAFKESLGDKLQEN